MTSTTPGPESRLEVLNEIQALFNWNPPCLVPPDLPPRSTKPSTASTATRQPAFYDKHFSGELVLEKIERLPSLVQDLSRNVDTALQAASKTLPPLYGFITAQTREFFMQSLDEIVSDEKGVASFYDKTTAIFCLPLASTLALHPTAEHSEWHSLLVWTQSAYPSGYAIMDGLLRFSGESTNEKTRAARRALVDDMESETRCIFEKIRKSMWPLATWAMKSTSAGPREVMAAVPNLGKFSWTTCDVPDCMQNSQCQKERDKVAEAAATIGPDALSPPWRFPEDLLEISHNSDEAIDILPPVVEPLPATPQRPATRRGTRSAAASSSSILPPSVTPQRPTTRSAAASRPSTLPLPVTPQRPTTRSVALSAAASGLSSPSILPPPPPRVSSALGHVSPTKGKSGKRKRDDGDEANHDLHDLSAQSLVQHARASGSLMLLPSPPSASEHVSPTIDKGKKRKLDDDDKAYQDQHDLTAQSLVQQAWAQAVRVDGTLIILHSGNYELVCIRHRTSQTLYVSKLIEPPKCTNPGYGKLQVGIYLAAIQDVMDRHKQLPTMCQPKPPDAGDLIGADNRDHNQDSGSDRKDDHGTHGGRREGGNEVRKSGRLQGSAGRLDPNADKLVAIEKTIHLANNRDMVLLYLRYGVYDSPVPASFLRSAPSVLARTRCPTPPFSPRAIHAHRLEECLTIVLTSEIGRGATGVVHRGTLKLELSDGAVPLDVVVKLSFDNEQRDALRNEYEAYRLLRSKGVLRGITTVLGFFHDSEDCACALVMLYAGVPLVTELQHMLSVSDRKSALSTLESIHRAGILHGDIRRENILMGDLGVTIIDFGHSKRCDDQKAKDKEFARLCNLLGLACERH